MKHIILTVVIFLISPETFAQSGPYPWLDAALPGSQSRVIDIVVPMGFIRVVADSNSFADWMRRLPLKDTDIHLKLYNGFDKWDQSSHYRVIDIDVGSKDLQQCADAVIRLRAEYLYANGKYDEIHFNFTSGDTAWFSEWAKGYRPIVNGDLVQWHKTMPASQDYQTFRSYLDTVFMYAGSHSLEKELVNVADLKSIRVGDIFIQGGFPGHAVIVVDVAKSQSDDKIAFLIAQSYMPAQDIHILNNPIDEEFSPWYIVNNGDRLDSPSWVFDWSSLRRFKN